MTKSVEKLSNIETEMKAINQEIIDAYSISWNDDVHDSFGTFFDEAEKIKANLGILKCELVVIKDTFEKMHLEQLKGQMLDILAIINTLSKI